MPSSSCDRGPVRQLRSLLRHPQPCADIPGTASATVLPTPRTPFVLSLLQNPRSAWARPSNVARALTKARPPPGGSSTLCHACLEDGTLHSNRHDAHRSYQDAGAISARTGRRPGQLHARRLTLQYLIVYLLQQISTVHPRFGEKTTTSDTPYMYAAPPCVYKRRRRAPY